MKNKNRGTLKFWRENRTICKQWIEDRRIACHSGQAYFSKYGKIPKCVDKFGFDWNLQYEIGQEKADGPNYHSGISPKNGVGSKKVRPF